jgi:hypothetical protein
MSGRARHLRDGVWITNRKTDRRRSPRRSPLERLHNLNITYARRFPNPWKVRLGFTLPEFIAPFVADGSHGIGINVIKGFVQVSHGSSEECFVSASEFLSVVAKDKPAFIVPGSLITVEVPPRTGGRWLSVVNGALVVCAGINEPRIYGDKCA